MNSSKSRLTALERLKNTLEPGISEFIRLTQDSRFGVPGGTKWNIECAEYLSMNLQQSRRRAGAKQKVIKPQEVARLLKNYPMILSAGVNNLGQQQHCTDSGQLSIQPSKNIIPGLFGSHLQQPKYININFNNDPRASENSFLPPILQNHQNFELFQRIVSMHESKLTHCASNHNVINRKRKHITNRSESAISGDCAQVSAYNTYSASKRVSPKNHYVTADPRLNSSIYQRASQSEVLTSTTSTLHNIYKSARITTKEKLCSDSNIPRNNCDQKPVGEVMMLPLNPPNSLQMSTTFNIIYDTDGKVANSTSAVRSQPELYSPQYRGPFGQPASIVSIGSSFHGVYSLGEDSITGVETRSLFTSTLPTPATDFDVWVNSLPSYNCDEGNQELLYSSEINPMWCTWKH